MTTAPRDQQGHTTMGRFRRLLWPGVMTMLMGLVLVGLGTWQVQRMHWKGRILAEIARAEASPPSPLGPEPQAFAKVVATGRLRPGLTALFGVETRSLPGGPQLGAHLIDVLDRDGARPLLVDLGWVPLRRDQPLALPQGTIAITGFVHPGDTPSWFSAADDPVERRFYTLDPARIAAALGVPNAEPFVLITLAPSPWTGWPEPTAHLPRPPDNHLIYALTWYGFAVTLAVIFFVWARRTIRA